MYEKKNPQITRKVTYFFYWMIFMMEELKTNLSKCLIEKNNPWSLVKHNQ